MNLTDTITRLERLLPDPSSGLPEQVFHAVSRMTPMVNVDLLVQDENGRTLLAWRDDPLSGAGWHIPGGVIRFRERLEHRLMKVAELEIGAPVSFDPLPLAVNQLIDPSLPARGHFISILYRCFLGSAFVPMNSGRSSASPGYLGWHDSCPPDLIKVHEIYRPYFHKNSQEGRAGP
jgi:colanic acid biosynthesis protein WcaH